MIGKLLTEVDRWLPNWIIRLRWRDGTFDRIPMPIREAWGLWFCYLSGLHLPIPSVSYLAVDLDGTRHELGRMPEIPTWSCLFCSHHLGDRGKGRLYDRRNSKSDVG